MHEELEVEHVSYVVRGFKVKKVAYGKFNKNRIDIKTIAC